MDDESSATDMRNEESGERERRGKKISKLRDVMRMSGGDGERESPRLAAKYWEEYSGKQTLLSTFFGKGSGSKNVTPIAPSFPLSSKQQTIVERKKASSDFTLVDVVDISDTTGPLASPTLLEAESCQPLSYNTVGPPPASTSPPPAAHPSPTAIQQPTSARTIPAPSLSQYPHEAKKRKQPDEPLAKSKRKKQKPGQTKLSTFFPQPSSSSISASGLTQEPNNEDQLDSDYRLAVQLTASQETLLSRADPASTPKSNGQQTTAAWTHLLAPIQPPKCIIHNEPAKELTVTKPGPNKGKNFFICSRPVGPGYDRGKAERLREEVDHQYRCNFFKWSNEVKREAMKEKPAIAMTGGSDGRP